MNINRWLLGLSLGEMRISLDFGLYLSFNENLF